MGRLRLCRFVDALVGSRHFVVQRFVGSELSFHRFSRSRYTLVGCGTLVVWRSTLVASHT